MKEKLNIAELLKDCPTGMELDCAIYDGATFIRVEGDEDTIYPIVISTGDGISITLTKYGQYTKTKSAKCVIFPKGKTTWEGFIPPFKNGDVLITNNNALCIYKSIHETYKDKNYIDFYCGYRQSDNQFVIKTTDNSHFGPISAAKLATEEEKQKLLDAIKANGYKWNPEAKTLEKLIEPKFKVGDIIKSICSQIKYKVTDIRDDVYITHHYSDKFGYHISFKEENNYELVPDKFDITTFRPFDKVLVRDGYKSKWVNTYFGFYDTLTNKNYSFIAGSVDWAQCIPYEGNEHLLGTTDDCDEYYKTWE